MEENRVPGPEANLDATRLGLIAAAGETLSGSALLSLSVGEAVAALDGMAGMAHVRVGRGLRLAVTDGVSAEAARVWAELPAESASAPAAAVRERQVVWRPLDREATGRGLGPLPPDACVVAAPLSGPDGFQGTLTVLQPRSGPPDDAEMKYLGRLASLTGSHLARRPCEDAGAGQSWPVESSFRLRAREADAGSWEWEPHTGRVTADDTAVRLAGLTPGTYDDRAATWFATVHPSDAPAVLASIERAVTDGRPFTAMYRLRGPGDRTLRVEAHGTAGCGDRPGEPVRWTGTVREVTAGSIGRSVPERAPGVPPVGFLTVDDAWRIVYADAEAERLLGGGGRLSGRVLWSLAPDTAAMREECLSAAATGREGESEICIPGTEQPRHLRVMPGRTGIAVSVTAGSTGKAALRLAEPFRPAGWGEQRSLMIGELTEELAQALTVRDVVRAMIAHVVPLFGAAGLLAAAIDGPRLRVVGSFGYDTSVTDLLDGMAVDAMTPAAEVLHDRAPRFVPSADEYVERYPHLAHLPTLGCKQAWAFLPLIASGRSVGYCALAFDTPRALGQEERTLLIALAGLVAHAFERARLYDAEHRRAEELQRGLLPRTLPALPAVSAAARYVPAGTGTQAGGDWYDVIPLSSERVALVVGDVMGLGVSEAVAMARIRAAVRTLADLDIPPDELLTRLDGVITTLGDSVIASCLYAVYDPTTGVVAFASAGHPPVAFVHPGGSAYFPPLDPNPPLGLARPPFSTVEVVLPPESLMVLYTNGLVQSPSADVDARLAEFGQALTQAAAEPPGEGDAGHLDALCRSVTTTLLPPDDPHHDDAVMLVARAHALDPRDVASWSLPEHPVAARQARELVRNQLADWDLDELSMTTELLVSELVGNVVRHAEGPVTLRLLRGRTLICEVSDGSLTTPRIRHAGAGDEGGRGLQLVAALSHRWGARFTPTGKCIWTEQRQPRGVVVN